MTTNSEMNPEMDKKKRGRPRKTEIASGKIESELSSLTKAFSSEDPIKFILFYKDLHSSQREKLITSGVTKNQLTCIKEALDVGYDEIADWLGVTTRSLHLKKADDKFNNLASYKIGTLLEVFCFALEIIGKKEDTVAWFMQNNILFNSHSPFNTAKTHIGILKVREMLYRIRIGQV